MGSQGHYLAYHDLQIWDRQLLAQDTFHFTRAEAYGAGRDDLTST